MSFSPMQDIVSGEEHRNVLRNFRIAHEKVEEQRRQLEEQERQVASLRAHIRVLEGDEVPNGLTVPTSRKGGQSLDDFSVKNAAAKLEKKINRWAADVIRSPPAELNVLRAAALSDLADGVDVEDNATEMHVQNLLRHAVSDTVAEGFINSLIITNSNEANVQLTRIHEHLFQRDPTVACVWRRQTFSAAVDACSPETFDRIMKDAAPALFDYLSTQERTVPPALASILNDAYSFSRMLHGGKTAGGLSDIFYRAFVPDIGAVLDATQMELVKRCVKAHRGEVDRVGACIFPGLVKVVGSRGPASKPKEGDGQDQVVVKRAQVICDCAMGIGGPPPFPPPMDTQYMNPAPPTFEQASFVASPTLSTPSSYSAGSYYDPRHTVMDRSLPLPPILQSGYGAPR